MPAQSSRGRDEKQGSMVFLPACRIMCTRMPNSASHTPPRTQFDLGSTAAPRSRSNIMRATLSIRALHRGGHVRKRGCKQHGGTSALRSMQSRVSRFGRGAVQLDPRESNVVVDFGEAVGGVTHDQLDHLFRPVRRHDVGSSRATPSTRSVSLTYDIALTPEQESISAMMRDVKSRSR